MKEIDFHRVTLGILLVLVSGLGIFTYSDITKLGFRVARLETATHYLVKRVDIREEDRNKADIELKPYRAWVAWLGDTNVIHLSLEWTNGGLFQITTYAIQPQAKGRP